MNPVRQYRHLRVATSSNPPLNDFEGFRKDDVHWQFAAPLRGCANFDWVQHFIHHLTSEGTAGFILANSSMSSNQTGDDDIQPTFRERAYASFAA